MNRLFIAAWPDATTTGRLRALDRPDAPGVRWIPEVNRHVTLRFLGEADPATAIELLSAARLPAATAVLGPAVERLGRRQIVVPVTGIDELAAAVRSATVAIGNDDPRPFRGHLTIARTRGDETSGVLGVPIVAGFRVGEITLVNSDLQPAGAVYTTLATFRTTGTTRDRRDPTPPHHR